MMPDENSDYFAERTLLNERGALGWLGSDSPFPQYRYLKNHESGVNALFFDGHVKVQLFGTKWRVLPATGWPPEEAPP